MYYFVLYVIMKLFQIDVNVLKKNMADNRTNYVKVRSRNNTFGRITDPGGVNPDPTFEGKSSIRLS